MCVRALLNYISHVVVFQFDVNGFAVIENFFSEEEADELRTAGMQLCENAPENDRAYFGKKMNEHYFLESANKIHYFYEKGALDDNGNLLVNKSVSLNKVCIMKATNQNWWDFVN